MPTYDGRGARTGRPAEAWSERVWPVMAGALTAVGLIGVWRGYGPLGTVMAFAGLWFLVFATVLGVMSESGISLRRAALVSRVGTLAVLVLIGLLLVFPGWGWLAAAACASTSPWVVGRIVPALRRRRLRRERRRATVPAPLHATPRTSGQAVVDRAFEEIVIDLGWDDPPD